jgi:hypothetical protein
MLDRIGLLIEWHPNPITADFFVEPSEESIAVLIVAASDIDPDKNTGRHQDPNHLIEDVAFGLGRKMVQGVTRDHGIKNGRR